MLLQVLWLWWNYHNVSQQCFIGILLRRMLIWIFCFVKGALKTALPLLNLRFPRWRAIKNGAKFLLMKFISNRTIPRLSRCWIFWRWAWQSSENSLSFMVSSLMGAPSFIASLIPIYSLDHELLFDQINRLIKIINDWCGYITL